jgi:hypothetical protein
MILELLGLEHDGKKMVDFLQKDGRAFGYIQIIMVIGKYIKEWWRLQLLFLFCL